MWTRRTMKELMKLLRGYYRVVCYEDRSSYVHGERDSFPRGDTQGRLPQGLESSKKYGFLRKASKFMMLEDSLFMKVTDMVLRKVPRKEEMYRILEANHEGSCIDHFAMKITLHEILHDRYVWPSIQKDVYHWYGVKDS